MTSNPFMVVGTDRYCTNIIEADNGKFLVKTDAERVMAAALPDLGVDVAVKIDDGAQRKQRWQRFFSRLAICRSRRVSAFEAIPLRSSATGVVK